MPEDELPGARPSAEEVIPSIGPTEGVESTLTSLEGPTAIQQVEIDKFIRQLERLTQGAPVLADLAGVFATGLVLSREGVLDEFKIHDWFTPPDLSFFINFGLSAAVLSIDAANLDHPSITVGVTMFDRNEIRHIFVRPHQTGYEVQVCQEYDSPWQPTHQVDNFLGRPLPNSPRLPDTEVAGRHFGRLLQILFRQLGG